MNHVEVERVAEGYAVSCVCPNLGSAQRAVSELLRIEPAAFEPAPRPLHQDDGA